VTIASPFRVKRGFSEAASTSDQPDQIHCFQAIAQCAKIQDANA
jgi:hypothetical protein